LDIAAIEMGSKRKNTDLDVDLESNDDQEMSHPTLRAAMEIEKKHNRENDASYGLLTEREQRLIDWTADQLLRILRRIVAKRAQSGQIGPNTGVIPQASASRTEVNVFDEVQECISFPSPEKEQAASSKLEVVDEAKVELHPDVIWQLFDYVTSISTLYRNNSFHNFEHAVHVTLSTTKMLNRIVSPGVNQNPTDAGETDFNKTHNYTENGYGIRDDPLCQFAAVFSALIHDTDHLGVSNAQLIKENSHLARVYKNQSVAEQNSVNIAWDMLMDPAFSELRNCIYTSEEEFVRFRQLVVNAVMATGMSFYYY
jgi:hypothetical protein